MSTLSAVVICCGKPEQVTRQVRDLYQQTKPPREILTATCCMDTRTFTAPGTVTLVGGHVDDWGHRFCELGIYTASSDYIMFANADDEYDPRFCETMLSYDTDLVACDYTTYQLDGDVMVTEPRVGKITRGNFIVNRRLAAAVGYRHREYIADGLFIEDLVRAGATVELVREVLYHHR